MRSLATLTAAASVAMIGMTRPMVRSLTIPDLKGFVAAFASGVAGAVVAAGVGMPSSIALACGAIAALVPGSLRRQSGDRASRKATARWPDFLAALRSRLATGASIPAACAEAGRHVGGRFSDLAAPAGRRFADHIERVRADWADPLSDRILTTLTLASTIGGAHVDAVLGALSQSVADDLRLRRAHDAALTQQRLTAGVALLAPWAILALSVATNPTAADAFATPTGNLLVGGGLVATGVGYALARRAARLSRIPRLFA